MATLVVVTRIATSAVPSEALPQTIEVGGSIGVIVGRVHPLS